MIIHETPGLLDTRSFTTFGINAKPNAKSPIGMFGTGLKYSIAVLMRQALKVTVWIGDQPYEFFTEKSEFRGKDFLSVRMRRQRGITRRWHTEELPYTTELGRNWELWMALRELHANTLDEGGRSFSSESWIAMGNENTTRIVVEGDAYDHEFCSLDKIFLPGERKTDNEAEILTGKSEYAYYRGMRVGKLQRQSLFTYCVNSSLQLTEDRTLAATYMWDWYVRRAIMGSTDEKVLRRVLEAGDDTYEGNIAWDESERSYASPAFLEAVRRWGRRKTYVFITRELSEKKAPLMDWRRQLMIALDGDDDAVLLKYVKECAPMLKGLLNTSYKEARADRSAFSQDTQDE
jgi:hypothetical protein